MTEVNGKMDSLENRLSSMHSTAPGSTIAPTRNMDNNRENPLGYEDELVDQVNQHSNSRPPSHDQVDGVYVQQVRAENIKGDFREIHSFSLGGVYVQKGTINMI